MTPQTSQTTINLVVIGLIAITLLMFGGAIGLAAARDAVPGELWTSGAVSLGALAAVLASTRGVSTAPTATAPPAETASK